jgi:hypothetical protein
LLALFAGVADLFSDVTPLVSFWDHARVIQLVLFPRYAREVFVERRGPVFLYKRLAPTGAYVCTEKILVGAFRRSSGFV